MGRANRNENEGRKRRRKLKTTSEEDDTESETTYDSDEISSVTDTSSTKKRKRKERKIHLDQRSSRENKDKMQRHRSKNKHDTKKGITKAKQRRSSTGSEQSPRDKNRRIESKDRRREEEEDMKRREGNRNSVKVTSKLKLYNNGKTLSSNRMISVACPSITPHEHLISITTDASEKLPPLPPPTKEKETSCKRRRSEEKRDKKKRTEKATTSKRKLSRQREQKDRKHDHSSKPSCPLCKNHFDCPVLLKCAHTFCKQCVTKFVETSDGKSFSCPVCSTTVCLQGRNEELFCPNFVVLKSIENEKSHDAEYICSACQYENEADYYCENCADVLCDGCIDAHRIVKYTKEHIIRKITADLDLSALNRKKYFCADHSNKILDGFCRTCDQSVCSQCVLTKHNGCHHCTVPIQIAAKSCRDELCRKSLMLKSHTPNLRLILIDVKQTKLALREQVVSVRDEISESTNRIISTLKDKEKELHKSVDSIYKSKASQLKKTKETIRVQLEKVEAVDRLISALEKHDNYVELLQMKSTISETLETLEEVNSTAKINKEKFLLKSNEQNITLELQKHGELFRVNDDGEGSTDNIKEGFLNQIFMSDFEDNNSIGSYGYLPLKSDKKAAKIQPRDVLQQHKRTTQRIMAIKQRAYANWLLVRSRIRDIVDYGKISGRIDFNIMQVLAPSWFNRKRESKTLLKLKRLRAVTLRARANWLLVSSRSSDIASYAKRKQKYSCPTRKTWRDYRRSLLSNKDKAGRNKYIAGTIRSCANWLLVKTRLQDIILYGMYRDHVENMNGKFNGVRRSRSLSPKKRTDSASNANLKSVNLSNHKGREKNVPRLSEKSSDRLNQSLHSWKQNGSYKHWNKLIAISPETTKIAKSKSLESLQPIGNSLQYWDDLVDGRGHKKTKKKKKNSEDDWDVLLTGRPILNQRRSKSEESLCSFEKRNAFKRWDQLLNVVNGNLVSEKRNEKALMQWDDLTKRLPKSETKRHNKKSLNHWDKLIVATPVNTVILEKRDTPQYDAVAQKSWDVLINGVEVNISSTRQSHKTWKTVNESLGRRRPSDDIQEIDKKWDVLLTATKPGEVNTEKKQHQWAAPASDQTDGFQHWGNLIKGSLVSTNKALHHWDLLMKRIDTSSDEKTSRHHWHNLIVGTKIYDQTSCGHWNALLEGVVLPKKGNRRMISHSSETVNESLNHWKNLIGGISTESNKILYNWSNLIEMSENLDTSGPLRNWDQLINSTTHTKPEKRALFHWDILLEGRIIKNREKVDEPEQKWDVLVASTKVKSATLSSSSGRNSFFRNWHQLTAKTPPLPKFKDKSDGKAFQKQNTLMNESIASKEEIVIGNWNSLLRDRPSFQKYDGTQPAGVKKLYEKPEQSSKDNKVLKMNIKNAKGQFHNVNLKLTSPDNSILSAHVAENSDGTFTIFCCPRIENDYNMFVSLSGDQFKQEIKVANFYGSFAGIRKKELDLACRAISLLRWHLTPGLLTKKGNKVVARKGSITEKHT